MVFSEQGIIFNSSTKSKKSLDYVSRMEIGMFNISQKTMPAAWIIWAIQQ